MHTMCLWYCLDGVFQFCAVDVDRTHGHTPPVSERPSMRAMAETSPYVIASPKIFNVLRHLLVSFGPSLDQKLGPTLYTCRVLGPPPDFVDIQ
jgi:hypothetical protein